MANSTLSIDFILTKNKDTLRKHNKLDKKEFDDIITLLKEFNSALDKAKKTPSGMPATPLAGASLSEIENYDSQLNLLKSEAAHRDQLNQNFLMLTDRLINEKSPLNVHIKNEILIFKNTLQFASKVVSSGKIAQDDENEFYATAQKIEDQNKNLKPSDKRRIIWGGILIGLGALLFIAALPTFVALFSIIGPAAAPILMGGMLGGLGLAMTGIYFCTSKTHQRHMHREISGLYQTVDLLFTKRKELPVANESKQDSNNLGFSA